MYYAIQCSLHGYGDWNLCSTFGGDDGDDVMPAIYLEEGAAMKDLEDWIKSCPEHSYRVVGVSKEALEKVFK